MYINEALEVVSFFMRLLWFQVKSKLVNNLNNLSILEYNISL